MSNRQKMLGVLLTGLLFLGAAGCTQQDSGAYDQAMEALNLGNYNLAEEKLAEAELSDDRPAEAARGMGILSLARGQYQEAMEYFEAAIEYAGAKNKTFIRDVKLYQAETFLAEEKLDEAEELCRELLEEGKSGKAEIILGRICLLQEDPEAAQEHFTASVSAEQSYENYLAIYDLYVNASMEADGAVFLEQALTLTPSDAEDYCSQGQVYYSLGETELAKTSFARAIDLGSTEAVPMMGSLYLENQEIQAARSMYQSYLNEAVRPAIAYNGLALCDLAEGDYDAALANISKGLAEEDTEIRESLLLNEIAAYEYKLDFQTAKSKMEEFLAEYPENEAAVRENLFLQSR
ncbi:MAG: tetratricopeptide repeat protein [Lachnospiraceae bacterium]|nr:tetratricopeptide repeat protein [Lachnospiraceae bacterium]